MGDKLDAILFGATGFTGKNTVLHATTVLKDFRWGVAGRNKERLQEVLKEMGAKVKKDLSNTPIILADVSNPESLLAMAKRCRIVINTCGPYRFFGEPVVRACIEAGAHHVDVSGEPQYMELMQLKYNELAKENGVYVVSACGFDSIPAEIGVVFIEKNFDGTINSIESFAQTGVKGGSGSDGASMHFGTWESAVYSFANYNELRTIRRQLHSEVLPELYPVLKRRSLIFRSQEINSVCLPFPGSDADVVMRSQRLLYKNDKKRPIQMYAYLAVGSWWASLKMAFIGVTFALLSRMQYGRRLLLKYPKLFSGGIVSHEGPTVEQMERTYFIVTLKARGWPKSVNVVTEGQSNNRNVEPPSKIVMARVSGLNPVYGFTCVSLLCTAKTILKESDKMPGTGGVLPPAAAFSKTNLINELESHEFGMKFEILSNN